MKTLLFSIGLTIAFNSYCQSLANIAKFDRDVVDMGKLKQDRDGINPYPPIDSITITNVGNSPLKIAHVQPSSFDLGIRYDHNPIAIGKNSVVRFAYRARFVGAFSKTFMVIFDGIAESKIITVKGEVVSQ